MGMSKLVLGADHGGYELKEAIKLFLAEAYPHMECSDLGTYDLTSVHYPDFAKKVCEAIISGKAEKGILVCGTGIGISMMANRYAGIRAAVVHDVFTAEMAKAHNNANVLCLGGRVTPVDLAQKCVKKWLDTEFENGRHSERIAMFDEKPKA
jgi:ribose 5-phosphate isomerase B